MTPQDDNNIRTGIGIGVGFVIALILVPLVLILCCCFGQVGLASLLPD